MVTTELSTYSAVLRIHSEDSSLEEITNLLKINPDNFLVKGSKAVPSNPKSYVRPANMWLLESDLEPTEPLEEHITRLIEFIESRVNDLRKLIETCEMDIFCGCFFENYSSYFSLSPQLLERITILPVKLIIKIYPLLASYDDSETYS